MTKLHMIVMLAEVIYTIFSEHSLYVLESVTNEHLGDNFVYVEPHRSLYGCWQAFKLALSIHEGFKDWLQLRFIKYVDVHARFFISSKICLFALVFIYFMFNLTRGVVRQ